MDNQSQNTSSEVGATPDPDVVAPASTSDSGAVAAADAPDEVAPAVSDSGAPAVVSDVDIPAATSSTPGIPASSLPTETIDEGRLPEESPSAVPSGDNDEDTLRAAGDSASPTDPDGEQTEDHVAPVTTHGQNNQGGTTKLQTLINFAKSSIGAGSFALPWAMMNAGVLLGSVGLVAVSLVSLYTMNLMLDCKNHIVENRQNQVVPQDDDELGEPLLPPSTESTTSRVRSYSNVASIIAPGWGRLVVEANVLFCNIGVCAGYLIFIGMNFQSAIEGLFDRTLNAAEVYGIILPIVIPLTWLSSFRHLAFSGMVGTVFLVVAMGFTYVSASETADFDMSKVTWVKLDTFPFFFGIASFLFCIHSMVIPMEIQMANRNKMPSVLNWACCIVLVINLPFAIFGYLAFGDGTAGYIFCNLQQSVFGQVVKLALCFELLCTYPLVLSPAIEILEELTIKQENSMSWRYYVKTRTLRTAVVISSLGFAWLVPAFQLVLSLVGGLSASLLAYVLPPMFHFMLMRSEGRPLKRVDYLHIALTLLGLGAVIMTTTLNIRSIVAKTRDHSIHYADRAEGGVC